MLGDTAVAVHPDDERYTALVGKTVRPAADGPADSRHRRRLRRPEVRDGRREGHARARPERLRGGQAPRPRARDRRHRLRRKDDEGRGRRVRGPRPGRGAEEGPPRTSTRRACAAARSRHLVPLARCQRCDTVLEPLVSIQWFVKIGPLADKAVAATEPGRDGVHARALEEDVRRVDEEHPRLVRLAPALVGARDPGVVLRGRARHRPEPGDGRPRPRAARAGSGAHARPRRLRHVVLVVAHAALGPRLAGQDAGPHALLPDDVLVTGFDILFFWVARMIMAGTWFDGRVALQATSSSTASSATRRARRCRRRRETSSTRSRCATSSARTRFASRSPSSPARAATSRSARRRVAGYRAFATKVWNADALRAAHAREETVRRPAGARLRSPRPRVDRWILDAPLGRRGPRERLPRGRTASTRPRTRSTSSSGPSSATATSR